jgi:hypothetical protein
VPDHLTYGEWGEVALVDVLWRTIRHPHARGNAADGAKALYEGGSGRSRCAESGKTAGLDRQALMTPACGDREGGDEKDATEAAFRSTGG